MTGDTIYAIGDVHGRADLLAATLDFIAADAARRGGESRIMFLGDIVDRGPDSRGAVQLVVDTLRRCPGSRLLLGNHDRWFLDYLQGDHSMTRLWLPQGGTETLQSYLPGSAALGGAEALIRRDFPEHVGALESASLIETAGDFAFVHAGVDPARPIDAQTERDCLWIREPFLEHVGRLSHVIVHGHTPLEPPLPVVTENRISLDTGAWFTGVLTTLAIEPARQVLGFYATAPEGQVHPVEPVPLDRGFGTVLDGFALRDD